MVYTRQTTSVEGTDQKEIVNQRGKYYTIAAARLIEPSPDYPTPMVSFRLSNGADSCYAQLRIEEFQHFVAVLTQWQELFLQHMPDLRQKEAVYTLAKAERDKQLAAIRQLTGTEEDGGMSPAKVLELAKMMSAQQQPPTGV